LLLTGFDRMRNKASNPYPPRFHIQLIIVSKEDAFW
jgi:hypothetical protein